MSSPADARRWWAASANNRRRIWGSKALSYSLWVLVTERNRFPPQQSAEILERRVPETGEASGRAAREFPERLGPTSIRTLRIRLARLLLRNRPREEQADHAGTPAPRSASGNARCLPRRCLAQDPKAQVRDVG